MMCMHYTIDMKLNYNYNLNTNMHMSLKKLDPLLFHSKTERVTVITSALYGFRSSHVEGDK